MQKKTEKKTTVDSLLDSRVFWAILSLVLATFIWVYYVSNYSTETTRTFYGVEVTYLGRDAMRESQSLIISKEENTSVNLTLTGSRREMSKLTSENLKAVVNLSTVSNPGYRTMAYTISYPSSVNSAAIREEVKQPQTVALQISRLSTRVVDVTGRFEGTVADGYALDAAGMSFDPAYITLFGPEEELEQVKCAGVVVDRDDVSASFTAAANYKLVDENGGVLSFEDVTADADSVTVTVPINRTKEVTLDVSLIYGGGVGEENVQKIIDPQTIAIAGDAATIDSINTIYVTTIDLSDYLTFPHSEYTIPLPNGTENLSGVSTAGVDLTFTGLETAYFVVTNLDYTNLAEGFKADVMDVTLGVTIRAPAETLENIETSNIRAVADLTDITTTSRAPVIVTVDGYPDAGAVGDYVLYVRVVPEGMADELSGDEDFLAPEPMPEETP